MNKNILYLIISSLLVLGIVVCTIKPNLDKKVGNKSGNIQLIHIPKEYKCEYCKDTGILPGGTICDACHCRGCGKLKENCTCDNK